jgi:hypothetical protein
MDLFNTFLQNFELNFLENKFFLSHLFLDQFLILFSLPRNKKKKIKD